MTYNGRFVEIIGASSWDHCSLRKEASVCLPDGEGGGGRPIDPTNVTKWDFMLVEWTMAFVLLYGVFLK